jgi:hypothetical protein
VKAEGRKQKAEGSQEVMSFSAAFFNPTDVSFGF